MIAIFISGLLIGLAGAGHCLGMCGGLASLLSINGEPSPLRLIFYNLGRILSYAVFALLLATVLQLTNADWYQHLILPLRTIAAVLLIFMGLYICGLSKVILRVEALGKHVWRYVQPFAKKLLPIQSHPQALFAGMLWGWLPCGLVYSTVLWATSQGSLITTLFAISGFALGTLPAMLLAGIFSQQLKHIWAHYHLNWLFGLLLVAYGIYTIPAVHALFASH